MFNLQTQKSEFSCSFYPAMAVLIKGHKEGTVNLSPPRRTPVMEQNKQMNILTEAGQNTAGNDTGRSRLPSLARMPGTADVNPRLSEDIRFFSKLRLFTVAGYFTAIIAMMSL